MGMESSNRADLDNLTAEEWAARTASRPRLPVGRIEQLTSTPSRVIHGNPPSGGTGVVEPLNRVVIRDEYDGLRAKHLALTEAAQEMYLMAEVLARVAAGDRSIDYARSLERFCRAALALREVLGAEVPEVPEELKR
jgi:hypothetical protein